MFIRILDSNDNPPVFSQPAYDVSVSEDAPVDMELLRVRASDMDERARLSFSIYGSADPVSMRLFRVNPGTGVVYTADRLDYEARTQHILTIMVGTQLFVLGFAYLAVTTNLCVCVITWALLKMMLFSENVLSFLANFFLLFFLLHPKTVSIFISHLTPGQGSGVSI